MLHYRLQRSLYWLFCSGEKGNLKSVLKYLLNTKFVEVVHVNEVEVIVKISIEIMKTFVKLKNFTSCMDFNH